LHPPWSVVFKSGGLMIDTMILQSFCIFHTDNNKIGFGNVRLGKEILSTDMINTMD